MADENDKNDWVDTAGALKATGWSRSTLHKKVKDRLVKKYKVRGQRTYYRLSELNMDFIMAKAQEEGLVLTDSGAS